MRLIKRQGPDQPNSQRPTDYISRLKVDSPMTNANIPSQSKVAPEVDSSIAPLRVSDELSLLRNPLTESEISLFELAALRADPLSHGRFIEISGTDIPNDPFLFQRLVDFSGGNPEQLLQRLRTESAFTLWRIDYHGYKDLSNRKLLGNAINVMEHAGLVIVQEDRAQTALVPNFSLHCYLMQLRYGKSYIDLVPQRSLATELEARSMLRAGLQPYCLSEEGLVDSLCIDGDPDVSAFAALLHDRAHQILRSSLDPQARMMCSYLEQLILSRMSDASCLEDLFTPFLPSPVWTPVSWKGREEEILLCLSELSYEILEADFQYGYSVDAHKQRVVPYEKRGALPLKQILRSTIGLFETSILDTAKSELVAAMAATHIIVHDFIVNEKKWTDQFQTRPSQLEWPAYGGDSYKFKGLIRKAHNELSVSQYNG